VVPESRGSEPSERKEWREWVLIARAFCAPTAVHGVALHVTEVEDVGDRFSATST